jgi:hypothetical protein
MATQLQVDETSKELHFRSRKQRSVVETALSVAVGISVFGLVAHHYASSTATVICSAVGALIGYLESFRHTTAELRATNLDFHTKTSSPFSVKRSIPRIEIRYLHFEEEMGGGDAPYRPSGLYAELRFGNACILPYIDEPQASTVAEAIYKRFPDIPKTSKSHFDDHFTTLGL